MFNLKNSFMAVFLIRVHYTFNVIPQNSVKPDSLRLEEVENVRYAKRILGAERVPTSVTHVHMDMSLTLDQHRKMIVILVSSQLFNKKF